jgi:hypothetical protein
MVESTDPTHGKETGDPVVMVTGVPDMNRPLYRIFPVWFFEAALRTNGGNLFLVRPHAWEDPFEDICDKIQFVTPDYRHTMLSPYLQPAFAQCWSFEGKSDALLRAYSRVSIDKASGRNADPKYEGVQVKTTPARLVAAINKFSKKRNNPNLKFYLGAVQYTDNPGGEITGLLDQVGPVAIGKGDNRAATLLKKRNAFYHEQEVRIILVGPSDMLTDSFLIDIDPNEVFEEVYFDPRLIMFERLEREQRARELGYKGPFGHNDSYQRTFFTTPLTKPWDELPEPNE